MYQVNIHEAKTNLSKLIKKVVSGEEVVIAKGNKPLVKMVLLNGKKPKRTLGSAKGALKVSEDFDEPLEDFKEFVREHIKGNDIGLLRIEPPHVLRVEQLPFHHRDPFDRLLISQSIENNLTLISSDKTFDLYKIQRIW